MAVGSSNGGMHLFVRYFELHSNTPLIASSGAAISFQTVFWLATSTTTAAAMKLVSSLTIKAAILLKFEYTHQLNLVNSGLQNKYCFQLG